MRQPWQSIRTCSPRSTSTTRRGLRPRLYPTSHAKSKSERVMSNSFGFGGHNARSPDRPIPAQ